MMWFGVESQTARSSAFASVIFASQGLVGQKPDAAGGTTHQGRFPDTRGRQGAIGRALARILGAYHHGLAAVEPDHIAPVGADIDLLAQPAAERELVRRGRSRLGPLEPDGLRADGEADPLAHRRHAALAGQIEPRAMQL